MLLQVHFVWKQLENLNLHSHVSLALSSSLLESIPSGGTCDLWVVPAGCSIPSVLQPLSESHGSANGEQLY